MMLTGNSLLTEGVELSGDCYSRDCWLIALWRHSFYEGRRGKGIPESLRQKDRADFIRRGQWRSLLFFLHYFLGCALGYIFLFYKRKERTI